MRFRHGLILALALLAPAASAHAQEPAFKGTLNASTPKFTWESSGTGAPGGDLVTDLHCLGGPWHCEYVLFNVEAAGELALNLESSEAEAAQGVPLVCEDTPCASYQDVDGNLYKSDASGAKQGDSLTNGDADAGEPDCATSFPSETCKLKVQPGFYVLEVTYYAAVEAPLKGTAELIGAAAPAAPVTETPASPPSSEPQPQTQPQPQPQPQQQPQQAQPAPKKASAKQRRAACTKKAKKIKNKGKRKKALKRCKKIR